MHHIKPIKQLRKVPKLSIIALVTFPFSGVQLEIYSFSFRNALRISYVFLVNTIGEANTGLHGHNKFA